MTLPLHHDQIVRNLPAWSKALKPEHASNMLDKLRKEYLDANGTPFDWYSSASQPRQQALQEAIEQRDAYRRALGKELAPLKGITEYCAPLLQQRLGTAIDVNKAIFVRTTQFLPVPPPGTPPVPGSVLTPEPVVLRHTLLEAALQNFRDEQRPLVEDALARSKTDNTEVSGLTPEAFVEHCRALDLGQAYQNHLNDVLNSTDSSYRHTWIAAHKAELRVQARIAALRGTLSDDGLTAIEQLCNGFDTPLYGEKVSQCWRLSVEGTPLYDILLIGPEPQGTISPVTVYCPGAPDGAVQEYASRQAATLAMLALLRDNNLRHNITAMAPQSLQVKLEQTLRKKLFDNPDKATGPVDTPHLAFTAQALENQPWQQLHNLHLERMKQDAREIAVPTKDVDAQAAIERYLHWLNIGLTVINVAAIFIPALTPLMLTLAAEQMMEDVFYGIEAWEDGDNAEALAHVGSILINLATTAAIGGSAAAIKRSGFVDAMYRAWGEQKERLWSPSLKPYRQDVPQLASLSPDADGIYTVQGRQYVRIEGNTHEVVADEQGQWRVRNPNDTNAYQPRLLGNGSGAWRLADESPMDWADNQLVRRFGPLCEHLDETDLDVALRATATDADTLRHAHINDQPAPALLADFLQRLQSDRIVTDLIRAVDEGKPLAGRHDAALNALVALPEWPQDHNVKVFEGPEPWGSSTDYSAPGSASTVELTLTRSDLESGDLGQQILDQLSEDARRTLQGNTAQLTGRSLDQRLAASLESNRQSLYDALYQGRQPTLTTQQSTLRSRFQGLPASALVEITRHATAGENTQLVEGRVPLRIAEEARLLQSRGRLDRAISGIYQPTLATADSQRLLDALTGEHPQATTAELLQYAISDRTHSATLIGQQPVRPSFRSPMRLSDGRAGYPLSGRLPLSQRLRNLGRNVPDERLQELYPGLDQQQRREMLARLRQRGNIMEQINALRRERDALDSQLMAWAQEVEGEQRVARQDLHRQLLRAWRRESETVPGMNNAASAAFLELDLHGLDSLPPILPARFDHVTSLFLRPLEVASLPPSFLQSFPSLRSLRVAFAGEQFDTNSLFRALSNTPRLRELLLPLCRITTLSPEARQALARLRELRRLELHRNDLVLNTADILLISRMPLEVLRLSSNQVVLDEAMAARLGQMPRLRWLDLSMNPNLGHPPELASMTQLIHLNLNDCGLQQWPRSLGELLGNEQSQLSIIELSNNHITQVPDLEQLLRTPFFTTLRDPNRTQRWNFEFNFNELEPETARRLRNAGVHIEEVGDFLPAGEAVTWLDDATAQQRQLWHDLFDDNANLQLREVIERLGRSAQARDNPAALAAQVWGLLREAGADIQLRDRLNEVAGEFPATCGDAGADGFSTLEVEVRAHRLSIGETRGYYLFQEYRRMFRRAEVDRLASRIYYARVSRRTAYLAWLELPEAQRPGLETLPALDPLDDLSLNELRRGLIDDIEIRLALRQALAERLDFFEPSQGMLYRETAQISSQVELNVEEEVERTDEIARKRRAWVSRQPSWRRFLERSFADRFDSVRQPWNLAQEYLQYCFDDTFEPVTTLPADVQAHLQPLLPGPMLDSNGQLQRVTLEELPYQIASRSVADARQAAVDALYQQLTDTQDRNA